MINTNHNINPKATAEGLRPRPAFLIYVRTLQFFAQRYREGEKRQPVYISTKEIEKRFFVWPDYNRKAEIQMLIDAGELKVHAFTNLKGYKIYKYEALRKGGIAPWMIKEQGLELDNIHKKMMQYLKDISLKPNSASTPYFNSFLSMKDSYLRLFFRVDAFANRIHTPVTNFHRTHRPNILLQGEETTSLDVATMQPLILGKVLKQSIGENEFSRWIDEGKDIYVMLQKKANLSTRDEGKKRFFEIMFAPANDNLLEMFGAANWIEWVNDFKRKHIKLNPHTIEKRHSNLAWLLQTTEVKIMRQVWEKMINNNIPFLSVHDEIIIKAKDKATAEGFFRIILDAEFDYYKLNSKTPESTQNEDSYLKSLYFENGRLMTNGYPAEWDTTNNVNYISQKTKDYILQCINKHSII